MQTRPLHLGAVLIAAVTFQHGHTSAQTVSPRSVTGAVAELRVQTSELAVTTEDGRSLLVKVSMDPAASDDPPAATASDSRTEARTAFTTPAAERTDREEPVCWAWSRQRPATRLLPNKRAT